MEVNEVTIALYFKQLLHALSKIIKRNWDQQQYYFY